MQLFRSGIAGFRCFGIEVEMSGKTSLRFKDWKDSDSLSRIKNEKYN